MEELSQEWLLIPFSVNLVLLAYLNHNFKEHFSGILLSTISYGSSNNLYREFKNYRSRPSFILNIIFFISVSVFSFQIINIYFPELIIINPILILIASGILFLLLTLLTKLVSSLSGFIFQKSEISSEFNQNIDYFNQSLGLILFPLSFLISFSGIPKIAVYVGIISFLLLYLLRIIRLMQINFNNQISIFYMFLYLCTVEILPILYIGKTLKII